MENYTKIKMTKIIQNNINALNLWYFDKIKKLTLFLLKNWLKRLKLRKYVSFPRELIKND